MSFVTADVAGMNTQERQVTCALYPEARMETWIVSKTEEMDSGSFQNPVVVCRVSVSLEVKFPSCSPIRWCVDISVVNVL